MPRLAVNIDHVATLRQARGTVYPDTLEAATICAEAGAAGITIHLREDRRHIQDADVYRLCNVCPLPINLEMANSEEIIQIALEVRPAEICLKALPPTKGMPQLFRPLDRWLGAS